MEIRTVYILLGIISGIGEYPWIEPLLDAIATQYDDAMTIGPNKLVIKEYLPLSMEELSLAVRMKCLVCFFA